MTQALTEVDEPISPQGPLVRIRDLELRGRRGTVFGPLDWDLYRGDRGVIVGQQGSGRSALLLALGGRLKGVRGSIEIDGFDGVTHPRRLRSLTSVAQVADLATLEPGLRVGEARDERALAEGLGVRQGRQRFSELQDVVGHRFDTDEVTEHLPAVHQSLLAALLGCLRPAAYTVLDDIDASLTDEQLGWLHHKLDLLAEAGNTVIVSTLDTAAIPAHANTLMLPDPAPIGSATPPLTPVTANSPASPTTPHEHEEV